MHTIINTKSAFIKFENIVGKLVFWENISRMYRSYGLVSKSQMSEVCGWYWWWRKFVIHIPTRHKTDPGRPFMYCNDNSWIVPIYLTGPWKQKNWCYLFSLLTTNHTGHISDKTVLAQLSWNMCYWFRRMLSEVIGKNSKQKSRNQ